MSLYKCNRVYACKHRKKCRFAYGIDDNHFKGLDPYRVNGRIWLANVEVRDDRKKNKSYEHYWEGCLYPGMVRMRRGE